jgi:putative ABC transport system permease protein
MSVLFTIAVRNLIQARRRSILLSAAIATVTGLLVVMTSLTGGIRETLVEEASTMFAGNVVVGGFFKSTPTQSAPVVTNRAEIKKILEENTPGLDYVTERGRGFGKMISPTGSAQVGMNGIPEEDIARLKAKIVLAKESEYKKGGSDQVFGSFDDLYKPNSALIFASQAKRLKVGVGDTLTLQTTALGGQNNTADVTIAAIGRDKGSFSSFSMFVPLPLVRELYRLNDDTTGAFWVFLKDIDESDAAMNHLRDVFSQKGYRLIDHQAVPFFFKFENVNNEDWTGQKIDVTTWFDELSIFARIIDALDAVGLFVITLLVFVVAAGIMNTMWNAVRERTREIGTMRAIGMTRARVLSLFLLEATFLGLFATVFGAVLGIAVSTGIDALHITFDSDAVRAILLADTLHLKVRPVAVVVAITSLTALTALAALFPAIRASLLRPVTALGAAD